MPTVTSTMTNAQDYAFYKKGGEGQWLVERVIHIRGGANLADKYLVTKNHATTDISDNEADMLLGRNGHAGHPDFLNHVKHGFIKVTGYLDKSKINDLSKADNSAPLTPEVYADEEAETGKNGKRKVTKPKTGKPE